MHAKTVKNIVRLHAVVQWISYFISGDISGDLSTDIGQFIGRYFKYRPFFAANDMANDFSIWYRQQAKKEISDDILADSTDI